MALVCLPIHPRLFSTRVKGLSPMTYIFLFDREESSSQDAVLACSALKKMYRRVLVSGVSAIESNQPEKPGENVALKILFVHLDGPIELIARRLEKRRGHFMPLELLKSQFDTLEPPKAPENFITVSLEKSLPEIVMEIEKAIFSG